MKYVLSRSAHLVCPACGSSQIARSRTRGLFEFILRWLLQIKPYRCSMCDHRHFRFRIGHSHHHNHPLPTAPK
jgi:hypothetical protein